MKKAIYLMIAIIGVIMAGPACASRVTSPLAPQTNVSPASRTTPPPIPQMVPFQTEQEKSLAKPIAAAQQEKKLNLYSGDVGRVAAKT